MIFSFHTHNPVWSPITALIWEILQRNRRLIWTVAGLSFFGWFFTLVVEERFAALNGTLSFASLILVFAIFNAVFPDRLFTLPVTTLSLVAVPMGVGLCAV